MNPTNGAATMSCSSPTLLARIAGLIFMAEIEPEGIKQGEYGSQIVMAQVVQAVFES